MVNTYSVKDTLLASSHSFRDMMHRYLQSKYTVQFMKRFVDFSGQHLLDFGSGNGEFCGYLDEQGVSVTCHMYEPSAAARKRSIDVYHFTPSVIFDSPQKIKKYRYQIVCSWYVYAYVADKPSYWEILDGSMKKGGYLFIGVNSPFCLYNLFGRVNTDLSWSVDLREVPQSLRLVGTFPHPYPTHMCRLHEVGLGKKIVKTCLYCIDRFLGFSEERIYVFRKQ